MPTRYFSTESARLWESFLFISAAPRLSVWPSMPSFFSPGFDFMRFAISFSIGKLWGRIVADALAKWTCSFSFSMPPSTR